MQEERRENPEIMVERKGGEDGLRDNGYIYVHIVSGIYFVRVHIFTGLNVYVSVDVSVSLYIC